MSAKSHPLSDILSSHRTFSGCLLVYLLFVLVCAIPSGALSSSDFDPAAIVVKIQVVRNPPSFHQPWQNLGRHATNGTGFIVAGNRILTNAHVVSNSVFIHVRRAGKTEKFPAEVEFFDHESDLALLKIDDARFFDGVDVLAIGSLPKVRDKVAVYGFPDGGDKMSITEGVVSRIEHINYAYSGAFMLGCQIDASINSGNSGGPVVKDNQVVGVAFQGMDFNYDNIGYMIPSPVIHQFLEDARDGTVQGVPDLGILMQKLESPYLREFYRLEDRENGALINTVLPGSPAEGILAVDDVILAVDGVDVAYDGTIEFRKGQRTYFGYLLQQKQIGDGARMLIKRGGVNRSVTVKLTRAIGDIRLVPAEHELLPRYFIVGGIVFQPLSLNYLQEFGGGNWFQAAPVELLNYYLNGEITYTGREIVLLSQVLADKVNIGYHELGDNVVKQVDGEDVRNFEHFVNLVEKSQNKYMTIIVNQGTKVLFDHATLLQATPRILKKYAIKADRRLSGKNMESTAGN